MTGYKLGIKEFDAAIGNIKPGSNILLIGPPMCGKNVILNNILYAGLENNEAAILVSTGETGESVIEWFEQNGLSIEKHKERFGIVDCMSKTLGLSVSDTPLIKRASSPVDLTGIGVKISQFLEEFWMKKGIRSTRLCVNSLSTILMYSNLQTVFRFLHVFTGRIKSANALGVYIIGEGMHEEQAIATLKQLFNGVLEIKMKNDFYYLRGFGFGTRPTNWFRYEIVNGKVIIKGD
ncbi:MAG: ATPase domain-containing protein [Methanocellales archaeon]